MRRAQSFDLARVRDGGALEIVGDDVEAAGRRGSGATIAAVLRGAGAGAGGRHDRGEGGG